MTKFFAQLLISVMLGVGIAVGSDPEVRGVAAEVWAEAGAATQSAVDATLHVIDDIDLTSAFSLNADASTNTQAEANTEVNGDAHGAVDVNGILNELNVDGSLSAESQAETNLETEGAGLTLKGILNTSLGIGTLFGD